MAPAYETSRNLMSPSLLKGWATSCSFRLAPAGCSGSPQTLSPGGVSEREPFILPWPTSSSWQGQISGEGFGRAGICLCGADGSAVLGIDLVGAICCMIRFISRVYGVACSGCRGGVSHLVYCLVAFHFCYQPFIVRRACERDDEYYSI